MIRLCASAFLCLYLAVPLQAVEKWALLIGINDYTKGPPHWDLKGCENDVAMTRELLTTKFGFPEENIKVLLSAQATNRNIARAIEEWLIARTQPEDIAYFHFSGHGSQMTDRDGDEDDGKDELICPANMQLRNASTVITDDQLRELLGRIPARNVTIVMDACHSGTGTRDLSLSRARYVDFEGEEGGTRAVVMTPAAEKKPKLPPPEKPPAPAAPAKPQSKLSGSGGMESGRKLQVSISGCRPEQTSADAYIGDDFYAGALTYNLIENMKKAPPDITYRQLMERVGRDIKAQKYTQIPQIEGDMDRPLFGTEISGAVATPFLVIQAAQGNQVTLNAGRAQKVTRGSVYAVFPPGETAFAGEGLGRIRVTEVEQTRARARILEGTQIAAGCRAREILHNSDPDRLKLLVETSDPGVKSAVQQQLSSIDFVQVVASDDQHFDHRLQIRPAASGLQAALTIDGVPGRPATGVDAASLVAALGPQLENAYAIKFLAGLDNPTPPFKVEVWANRTPPGKRAVVVEALNKAEDEKLVQARLRDVIRFNFRAERDCYLTLINVGTSGKITVLFPNRYRPDGFIRSGRIYRTGTKGEMPFNIRALPPAGRELVKVIATLDPLDLSSLKMGQAGGEGTRNIESGSEFAQQLTRDLAVEDLGEGLDVTLLPTDRWTTDYLIIETTP